MAESHSAPVPPAPLGATGRALWRKVVNDLPDELELDARDLIVLCQAAKLADTIYALEKAVEEDGRVLHGPRGIRLHPGVSEVRQSQIVLGRLLSQIDMDLTGASQSTSSRKARELARRRWAQAGPSRRGEAA
jgi:phage terminase small subunit